MKWKMLCCQCDLCYVLLMFSLQGSQIRFSGMKAFCANAWSVFIKLGSAVHFIRTFSCFRFFSELVLSRLFVALKMRPLKPEKSKFAIAWIISSACLSAFLNTDSWTHFLCFCSQRITALEKGQCTIAAWDGTGHVRCRKIPPTRPQILKMTWFDPSTGTEKILWKEIDRQSRIIFPLLFLCFVCGYWPILLWKSSKM